MIYLVCGENVYGCEQRLQTLLDEHVKQVKAVSVDMSEIDSLETLTSRLQGSSLFAESETIIIRYLEDEKALHAKTAELLKSAPEDNIVIIYIPGTKPSNTLVKKLTKLADKTFVEAVPNEHELSKWALDEITKRGGKTNAATARALVDWVGPDQMSLSNEIDKLVAYDKKVTKDNIKEVAVPSPRTTIFQMLDAMMRGEAEQATEYLEDLKAQQLDETYITSMICWQAHSLNVAVATKGQNQSQVARRTGVSPFVLRKAADVTHNLSKRDIVKLNEYILKADHELKTAPVDKEQLVEQLIRRVAFTQS